MDEEKKTGLADAVETGASAAHTIKGAIKAGKAISGAAKGAAAGGPGRLGRTQAHRQDHCRHYHSAFAPGTVYPDAPGAYLWRSG